MMFRAGFGTNIVISEIPDRIPPTYPVKLHEHIEESVGELKARGTILQPPTGSASFAGQHGSRDGEVRRSDRAPLERSVQHAP